ncbi:MAG: peptidylprolyl isomerase [Gemmataceae bacterium]
MTNRFSWVFALGLAFTYLVHGQSLSRPAATVNGVAISIEQVQAELQNLPVALPDAPEQQRTRQLEVLGLLIDRELLRQFLDKHVGRVTPEAVEKRLAEFETALLRREHKISLADFCQDTNQTPEQLKACLIEQHRWNQYLATRLTDGYLEQYYRENRAIFDKVTIRASHIALRVPVGASPEEKEQIRDRLVKLRAELLANPSLDFAEMARKHSQGAQAERGGDLGYFPRKWVFEEPFAREAFRLQHLGAISEVVETSFGYHLIKLTDRRVGERTEFSQVKEAVRAHCAQELRQSILEQQRKAALAAKTLQIELP